MKASSGALLAVMAVAALATTALAKNYTVDGSTGWDTYVSYDKWTAGKTFMVGDNIEFKYEVYHNVLEVTKADYASCATGSPISIHSGGDTTFELTNIGTRYFICGIPRHCSNGTMHVMITTVAYDARHRCRNRSSGGARRCSFFGPGSSPPADVYAEARTAPAGAPAASAPKSSATRYQQTLAAVAGLAFAALLAIAA
ncbi:hypothetical protein ACQ4PT_065845 [Festuca glaucescens]